ncbi:MAG: FHA domain-containing protein [Mariprofundaceae bacterium]|nr:FHA domain-containing protein [Mariprofundaceae bacterium]
MSKLVLKFKDTVISEIELSQEETSIGRKAENTVHIDNLAVSGRHARILKIGNKVILEDLGSTNGTLVNNKEVTKHIMKHGDIVSVGKHTLTFVSLENGKMPAVEEDDMDKTMIISSAAREALVSKGPASASSAMLLGTIQFVSGPMVGKSFDLTASLTSMGKGDNCKIKVKGLMVGKQAAVITRRPTGYHIAYLEGMSKPKVNGKSVADTPRTLKDGDMIELGDVKMEFYIKK